MKRSPRGVKFPNTAPRSGASVNRDLPSGIDRELLHHMTQTEAYFRAERRGFAVPELRDKVIRTEAARRKRFDGGDTDTHLLQVESEVDLMLQGTAEVRRYVDHLAASLGNWDQQFHYLKSELESRKIKAAEYDRYTEIVLASRTEIRDKLQALREYPGEVWGEMKDSIEQALERMVKAIERIASGLGGNAVQAAAKPRRGTLE